MSFLGGIFDTVKSVLPAAGTALGTLVGGPIGGMIGGSLGQAVGGSGGGSSGGYPGYSSGQGANGFTSGLSQMYSGGSRGLSTSFGNQGSTQLGTGVWGSQAPYLQDLFARAQATNQGQGMPNYGQAQNALDASQAGYMGIANQSGVDPRLGIYSRAIGQNFNENILPGLRGDAQMAGGLGSSRAGIGQGLAAARAGQQVQDFAGSLYGEDQNRRLQALQGLGNVAGQQQGLQNAMQSAPWAALQQYKGLLGAPIQNNLGGTSFGTTGSNASNSMDYGLAGQGGNGVLGALGSQFGPGGGGLGSLGNIGNQLGGIFNGLFGNPTSGLDDGGSNMSGSFGGFNPWGGATANAPQFGGFNPWA